MALSDSFVKHEEFKDELERERAEAYLEEAGLEGREIKKLQGTMLSFEEAIAAKEEQLENARARRSRKEDWEEFIDEKRRRGQTLHHSEIVRRLKRLMSSLIVAPSAQQGRFSLYVVKNFPIREIKDYPRFNFKMDHVAVPLYIGWIEAGWSPEYEVDIVNDVGIAVGQRRGWRTLLLRSIARRKPHCQRCLENPATHPSVKGKPSSLFTEKEARKIFGLPTNGGTASHFRRLMYQFRNGLK